MGGLHSRCRSEKTPDPKPARQFRFFLQGLPGAGKTSYVYRLKHGEAPPTFMVTIGADFQVFHYEGEKVLGWDLPSRGRIRPLHRSQHRGADGVIYVIDSAAVEQLDNILEELNRLVLQSEDLANKVVMVLANKQDLETALTPADIEARIVEKCPVGLGITLFTMPCSVVTGEGLWESFSQFFKIVKEKKNDQEVQVPSGLMPRVWETANQMADKDEFDDTDTIKELVDFNKDTYGAIKVTNDDEQERNDVMKDADDVTKETNGDVKDTDDVPKVTDDVTKDTDDVMKNKNDVMKDTDDIIRYTGKSPNMIHKVKESKFKDPLNLLKSIFFH